MAALAFGLLTRATLGVAGAQSCHVSTLPGAEQAEGHSLRASLAAIFASYRTASDRGEYQGLVPAFSVTHPRWFGEVSVPGYRLVRNQDAGYGAGDVAAELRVAAYRSASGSLSAGIGMATTFPSGDAARGFGMGHVMLMPGAYFLWSHAGLVVLAQASYGRALGAPLNDPHAHHHGPGSLVQPMNASELEHGVAAAYELDTHLRVLLRVAGAVPIAQTNGQTRELIGLGAQALVGPVDAGLELQLPLAGSPFTAKALLHAGFTW